MPKLTPIQASFSAGEISPLMLMQSETEGYKQGLQTLENMFADSRGPVIARGGSKHIESLDGHDARAISFPINDNFFYTVMLTDQKLTIGSVSGHNPSVLYNVNANFNLSSPPWVVGSDGNVTSIASFPYGKCTLSLEKATNRYVYISQEFTVPSTGNYKFIWDMGGNFPVHYKLGTTEDGNDIYSSLESSATGEVVVNVTSTTIWITARIDSDNITTWETDILFLGLTDEFPSLVEFSTPYSDNELASVQYIPNPSGRAIYLVHENHPPYKLVYDRTVDSFTFIPVTFTDDSTATGPDPCSGVAAVPPEWVTGNYPSCGDFFEGRLWLGGTLNEPQTFWASKSGCPEVFVSAILTNADSPLQFTMAKFGRIEWMVGFKNLVIGTQNGEHIVTSEGGFIKPDDIQVEKQSSYGSANVQPVQVGDQIFYVSADRQKLRAIQYEWQKDNWLSKDLTFNSEHITSAGIKHVAWQQNPKNLFHCVLLDGTIATLTYERSHNIYGWSKLIFQGVVLDVTIGPLQGTDISSAMIRFTEGKVYLESQSVVRHHHHMDSWIHTTPTVEGGLICEGLDHLEGMVVQVLVDDASHPDRTVSGGQITLQSTGIEITVGLKYTSKLVTLPFDKGAPAGSGAGWQKRYNKIFVRVLNSSLPLINGERAPERNPSTPMNTPQPVASDEIQKINLGHSKHGIITIEQDLPNHLIVLGVFGELAQSIT